MAFRWILLFFAVVACVHAYPYGAPSSICGRVVPGHRNMGTPVMNGPMAGPFMLTATPEGNGIFKVTLRSTTAVPFKGFLIQAVQSWKQLPDEAGDVVGMFQQDFTGRTQLRRCNSPSGSNALTHTFNDTKTMIEASWQAPMNLRDPSVRFVATVVRDYDNFYVVRSAPVMVSEDFATQSTRVTVPGNTGQPFNNNNNFPMVRPTNPSFPPLSPAINATAISTQGQGLPGQLQPGSPGLQGNQFGNRFGPQAPFRQPRFGMPGMRGPFGQQPRFGPGQGQTFGFPGGRPGPFGGRGGMFNQQPPRLNGINLPLGGTQFQGQSGTTDTQLGQGQGQFNGGQQLGPQTDLSGTAGDQVSSSNLFGGQFGTPVGQPGRGTFGQFGQTRPFGPGFRDADNPFQPFTPPGFPTDGRIQFSGFGQRPQPGQFGAFGQRQFGGRGPFAGQGQFRGQSPFGTQTNLRPDQFGLNRFGSPTFSRGIGQSPIGTQFGRTSFGRTQGPGPLPGVSPSNQLNTFANVPPQGGQGTGTGTFNFNAQTSTGLSGQSSGNLFNQLSQPSDSTVNNLGTGNAQNSAQSPTNDQTLPAVSSGDLSNFSFGPFTPNTK